MSYKVEGCGIEECEVKSGWHPDVAIFLFSFLLSFFGKKSSFVMQQEILKNLKAAESSPPPTPPPPKPCPSPPFRPLDPHIHPLKITGRPNMRTWSQFNHRNIGIARRISGI